MPFGNTGLSGFKTGHSVYILYLLYSIVRGLSLQLSTSNSIYKKVYINITCFVVTTVKHPLDSVLTLLEGASTPQVFPDIEEDLVNDYS